jgi:hypothetical protein
MPSYNFAMFNFLVFLCQSQLGASFFGVKAVAVAKATKK